MTSEQTSPSVWDKGMWNEVWFRESEKPAHEVTISQGFWLATYETTQAQWEAVMETTPWVGQDRVQGNPNHPAVYISWEDVHGFIHRLNEAVGDSLYRLPPEAAWEYACRAGTTTLWSFGDDESQLGILRVVGFPGMMVNCLANHFR